MRPDRRMYTDITNHRDEFGEDFSVDDWFDSAGDMEDFIYYGEDCTYSER